MGLSLNTGIKVLTFLSIFMALFLLIGTSWIFGSQMIDLDRKLKEFHLNNSDASVLGDNYKPEPNNLQEIIKDLKIAWSKNKTILITCSAIALFAGLIQLSVSLFVLFSADKSIRKRTRVWLIAHFMIFITLIVGLITIFCMRMSKVEMKTWFEIVNELETILKNVKPKSNFDELYTFLRIGQPLYYGVVIPDLVACVIVFSFGLCMLHKYRDYETQE